MKKYFYAHIPFTQALFGTRKNPAIKAVDGVTLEVLQGEIFGLIGESGSGKSTLGKLVMKLLEPTEGRIEFDNRDVTHIIREELAAYRSRVQMIFQDPFSSLNPRFTVKKVLEEPLLLHHRELLSEKRFNRILNALEEVKLSPPQEYLNRFPHMLSGGQRQRVATARTLILNPRLIVADEPVSMIDLSTRAEILQMMKEVQKNLGLTYLYITHDLSTARYFTDRMAVLYLGKVVELGRTEDLIRYPVHPYTRALIAAVPEPVPGLVHTLKELPIKGEIPKPTQIPAGCRFHPRCPYATRECSEPPEPELLDIGNDHLHACRRWKEILR
ncbi:MAG: ABC transporter ATP-binding protein [Spirochaetales bacterium]